MRLRIDEAALSREADRITAEVARLMPRQHVADGALRKSMGALPCPVSVDRFSPAAMYNHRPVDPADRSTVRYYAADGRLDRMIADPAVDIRDVVREVERLCECEAGASKSYRARPELLYPSHPWMQFVATGEAAYLGWESNQQEWALPEALCDHRKLLADLRMGVGVALHPKVCSECGASILYP